MGPDFGNLALHRRMLRDRVRCESYRRAIMETVRPGNAVLDVGCGTGILGIFAVFAGAGKVYAVERTSVAEFARALARANGADRCMEVMRQEAERVELPESVDVVVSELLGHLGTDENFLKPILEVRDRWLKTGGAMIPSKVSSWMAPCEDPHVEADMDFWEGRPYGVDLGLMAGVVARQIHRRRHDIGPESLLADGEKLWETDLLACPSERKDLPLRASLTFRARREGRLSALAGWFRAELAPGIHLTNAPGAPDTHWGRVTFNLEKPLRVGKGQAMEVEFASEPVGPDETYSRWAVRLEGKDWARQEQFGSLSPVSLPGVHRVG